jgi:hypothetical protein
MAKWEDAPLEAKWAQAPLADVDPSNLEQTGTVSAALEGVGQGLSFGFSDEMEGLARALYQKYAGDGKKSFGELYDEAVAVPRKRQAQAARSNPLAYYGGELVSGIAVPGGLARAGIRGAVAGAANRGLAARSLAGAREGAAYGAAYGTGKAEGGIPERLTGALQGAAVGGAIGAAAPGAIDALGAVGQRVAAPIRGVMNPRGMAAEKFGEAIARDAGIGAGDAAEGAGRFADRSGRMAFVNDRSVVADAGGENVRGLMRSAGNVPNEAREATRRALDARQGTQWKRIEDALVRDMGNSNNFYESVDMLAQRMDDIGARNIQPALLVETPITPRLASVLDRPTAKELRGLVERKIADEGRPIGFETRTEMIHRMKMELDDQIGMAMRAEKMGNKPQAGWDARTLTILRRDLLNAVDNDMYKAGLRRYAGQARMSDAAESGYDNFSRSQPEQIRAALRGMQTDVERDFYRLGAMRAVIERIRKANATSDRTENIFSSPEMQMKLRAIFPDQRRFREFQRSLVVEAKMADTRKAMQGNSTTVRQLAEGSDAGKVSRGVTSVMNAMTGRLEPVMNMLATGYNAFSGMTPGVAAETLRLGMSRDPQVIQNLARAGMERAARIPQQRAGRAQRAIAGGSAAAPLEVTVYPPGDPRNR